MLIKQTRIQTSSGSGKIINHVFDKAYENEKIDVIQGDRSLVDSCFDMSESMEKKYAVRHFIVSSLEPLTPEQNQKIFNMIGDEFGFSISDSTIVEHRKQRQDGTGWDYHHHILQSEILPDGRIMSNRGTMLRNEKLSRRFEIEEGLKLIPGKWNQAVRKAFEAEGLQTHAEKMNPLCEIERPGAAYSFDKHQEMKRKGKSMPAIKSQINELWTRSDGIKSFLSGLSESGFHIEQGTKNKKTYVIFDDEGNKIGTASRIIKGIKQNEFLQLMQERDNETMDKQTSGRNQTRDQDTSEKANADTEKARTIGGGIGTKKAPGRPIVRKSNGRHSEGGNDNRDESGRNPEPIERINGDRGSRSNTGTEGLTNEIHREPKQDSGRPERIDFVAIRRKKIERARIRDALKGFRGGDQDRHFSDRKILEFDEIKKITQANWAETQRKKKEYYEQIRAIQYMQNLTDAHNNAISANFALMITDFILRLFGYTIRKENVKRQIDILPPRDLEAMTREQFHQMTESQQDYFVRQSLKIYKNEYDKYVDLCAKNNVHHVSAFSEYLMEVKKNGGDWMTEEMINMYPMEYMKHLESSENVEDKRVFDELRRLVNDEEGGFPGDHNRYSAQEVRLNIEKLEAITRQDLRAHQAEEIELKRLRDEWYAIPETTPAPADPTHSTQGPRIK